MALALKTLDRPRAAQVSRELVAKANYEDVAKVFVDAVFLR